MNDSVADRLDIIDTVSRFAEAIDTRDWVGYRAVFTDVVDIDYSSYRPGSIASLPADEWVERARRLFPGFDATQHSISNHRIHLDGDRARVDAYLRADHVLANREGGSVFTIGGRYHMRLERRLDGWRIAAVTLEVLWNEGNRHVLTLAAERAPKHDVNE